MLPLILFPERVSTKKDNKCSRQSTVYGLCTKQASIETAPWYYNKARTAPLIVSFISEDLIDRTKDQNMSDLS